MPRRFRAMAIARPVKPSPYTAHHVTMLRVSCNKGLDYTMFAAELLSNAIFVRARI
jgi:hypothetical protein